MKNKKIALTLCTLLLAPSIAKAGETIKYNNFSLDYSLNVGGYYGIAKTKDLNNVDNPSNRWVNDNIYNFKGAYDFGGGYKASIVADGELIFRSHDTENRNGEWRFYPYASLESPYGEVITGYDFNVAYNFHQGAKDIGFLGIRDSALGDYLVLPNWVNGKNQSGAKTPKATALMDDGRALKFSYITPEIYNTKLGFTYTPNNQNRRGMVSRYVDYDKKKDSYVFAMHNKWDLGFAELHTSAGYGIINRTDKQTSVGATLKKDGLRIGSGYKKSYVDGKRNPMTEVSSNPRLTDYFDNYRESKAWDFSVGYDFGKYETSLAYLYTKADRTRNRDDVYILSNKYSLNDNLDLLLVGAYVNSKAAQRQSDDNNKGYAVVTGFNIKF